MANPVTAHYWLPIADLLSDESISDIYVTRHDHVAIRRAGQLQRLDGLAWASSADFQNALLHLARSAGLELAAEGGVFDAMLGDIRVNAALPPRALHAHATLRIPRKQHFTLDDLESNGMIAPAMRQCLRRLLDAQLNHLISGVTGSGKTTLLRALAPYGAEHAMTYIIEDTPELGLRLPYMVHHTTPHDPRRREDLPDPAVESIYSALRSAPDRVIVGEIRRPAQLTAFLRVLASGFHGSSTIHATPGEGVLNRAREMLMEVIRFADPAGYDAMVLNNVDALLHCKLLPGVGLRLAQFDWVDRTSSARLRTLHRYVGHTLRSDSGGIEAFLRHVDTIC